MRSVPGLALLLAVLALSVLPVAGSTADERPVVRVAAAQTAVPLVPRVALVDPAGELSAAEALGGLSGPDAVVENAVYSRGYIADTLWARIALDVEPAAAGTWYLSLELPNFDRLDIFTVPPAGDPVPFVTLGDRAPVPKPIQTRFHIAPIDLPAGQTVLLVRGWTGSTMTVDLKLRKLDALLAEEQSFFALQTFYLGIAATLGLSALGLFAYTRQVIHLIYVVNLVAHLGIWLIINGTGPGYLWPGLAGRLHIDPHVMIALSIFGTLAFSAIFLSTARVPRLVRFTLWIGAGVGVVLFAICLGVPVELTPWSSALVSQFLLPLAGLLLVPTAVALFYGEPAARPLMLTWFGFIAVIAVGTLRSQGYLPSNTLTLTGPQLGSVFEMLVFAYMLVARLGRVQREKDQVQREALAAARAHEAQLEQRVADRTAELDAAVVRERDARRLQQQFVSMVSHEFRTPLAIVDAAAQNFATGDAGDHGRLDKIRGAVRRLRGMIETCLVDERVQGGKIQLQPEDVELRDMVEDAVGMLRAAAADRRFVLDLPGEPVVVTVDQRLVGVAISNVLENAVKYSPVGSTIEVSVAEGAEDVEIAVTDQGPGVAEGDRDRIFERHYRAGNAAATSGVGLGLFLVRSILEAHGGTVRCTAGPAGGSRFVIRLPAADELAEPAA